jgi:sec-independent protein translocase protein TatB
MFSLGFGEILIICVILIIVVGPERLPTVMKGVGKTMRTVREASREIRTTVGLDELMRDDPPRPVYRPPPPATVARAQPLPATTDPNAVNAQPADSAKPVDPAASAASETAATTANAVPAAPLAEVQVPAAPMAAPPVAAPAAEPAAAIAPAPAPPPDDAGKSGV